MLTLGPPRKDEVLTSMLNHKELQYREQAMNSMAELINLCSNSSAEIVSTKSVSIAS